MVTAIVEIICMQNFLIDLNMKFADNMVLYCDNKSAIQIAMNGTSKRTKHVQIKDSFVRENIEKDAVKLEYIPTADMVAEIFTKSLTVTKHNFLKKKT